MTVKELIEILEPMREDLEVRMAEVLEEKDGEPIFHYPNITYVEYDKKTLDHPVIIIM